jgi:hypothetical protein
MGIAKTAAVGRVAAEKLRIFSGPGVERPLSFFRHDEFQPPRPLGLARIPMRMNGSGGNVQTFTGLHNNGFLALFLKDGGAGNGSITKWTDGAQPAVSKSIADLESVLGVQLFDRTNRGVEPTPTVTSCCAAPPA